MTFLIIDTESSGLFDYKKPADAPGQPRVCAAALIFTDENYQVIEERYDLIQPDGWVLDPECEAAKVNGLTQERLMAEGVPIANLLGAYTGAIQAKRVVCGHNVEFDMKLMRAELRHAKREDLYMQTRSVCTMWGTRGICQIPNAKGNGSKIPSLEECCQFFGIPQAEQHNALEDARSALAILRAVRERGMVLKVKNPWDKGKGPSYGHAVPGEIA